MDLYLPKIATILSQSHLAGCLKFFGPKRYTNNRFFGEPLISWLAMFWSISYGALAMFERTESNETQTVEQIQNCTWDKTIFFVISLERFQLEPTYSNLACEGSSFWPTLTFSKLPSRSSKVIAIAARVRGNIHLLPGGGVRGLRAGVDHQGLGPAGPVPDRYFPRLREMS